MPTGAPHACARPGCPRLVPHGAGAYCADHARTSEAAEVRRTKLRSPFYGTVSWLRMRASYLRAHPLCAICGGLASLVDHVVPIAKGGAPLDEANLRPMCAGCHARLEGHGWHAR